MRIRRLIKVPSPVLLISVNDFEGPPGTSEEFPLLPHPSLGAGDEIAGVQRREVANRGARIEKSMTRSQNAAPRHGPPGALMAYSRH